MIPLCLSVPDSLFFLTLTRVRRTGCLNFLSRVNYGLSAGFSIRRHPAPYSRRVHNSLI